MKARVAQIRIHKNNFFVRVGKNRRQIDRDHAFSLGGNRTRHHECFFRKIRIAVDDPGTQAPERFSHQRMPGPIRHICGNGIRVFFVRFMARNWNQAQKFQNRFHIQRGLKSLIQGFKQKTQSDSNKKAKQ